MRIKLAYNSLVSPRGGALEISIGFGELAVNLNSQISDSIATVESRSDLLVRLHEFVELEIEIFVLYFKHVDVLL